jgi:hypothetical protein
MSGNEGRVKKTGHSSLDSALLLSLSDEIGEYLSTVSKQMAKTLGGKDSEYEGFCFIGRDRKTKKLRAQLVMNVHNDRISTTFNGSDVEDLERFVHAWANHTVINKMVRVK